MTASYSVSAQLNSFAMARATNCFVPGMCPKVEVHVTLTELIHHRALSHAWFTWNRAQVAARLDAPAHNETTPRGMRPRALRAALSLTYEELMAKNKSMWRPTLGEPLRAADAAKLARAPLRTVPATSPPSMRSPWPTAVDVPPSRPLATPAALLSSGSALDTFDLTHSLTLGIKHMADFAERRELLAQLLGSIEAHYPGVPTIVAYEGEHSYPSRAGHTTYVKLSDTALGLSAGRNAVVRRATTEFVMILDDDVLLHEGSRLATLVGHLRRDPALDLVAACYRSPGKEGEDCYASKFTTDGRRVTTTPVRIERGAGAQRADVTHNGERATPTFPRPLLSPPLVLTCQVCVPTRGGRQPSWRAPPHSCSSLGTSAKPFLSTRPSSRSWPLTDVASPSMRR